MTSHPFGSDLEICLDALKEAKIKVESALDHNTAATGIKTSLVTRLVGAINYIGGLMGEPLHGSGLKASPTFAPVTHIFGKEVGRNPAITKSDLQPTPTEKDQFLAERKEFFNSIPTFTAEQILNKAELPGGSVIVRSCAKLVNMDDWQEGEINIAFVGELMSRVNAHLANAEVVENVEGKVAGLSDTAMALAAGK